jgi:hypothetical protein
MLPSLEILSHATITTPERPLNQHDTYILSDLFPSIRALCHGVRARQSVRLLHEYFGVQKAREVMEFWGAGQGDGY